MLKTNRQNQMNQTLQSIVELRCSAVHLAKQDKLLPEEKRNEYKSKELIIHMCKLMHQDPKEYLRLYNQSYH